jgi:hypothetical protein
MGFKTGFDPGQKSNLRIDLHGRRELREPDEDRQTFTLKIAPSGCHHGGVLHERRFACPRAPEDHKARKRMDRFIRRKSPLPTRSVSVLISRDASPHRSLILTIALNRNILMADDFRHHKNGFKLLRRQVWKPKSHEGFFAKLFLNQFTVTRSRHNAISVEPCRGSRLLSGDGLSQQPQGSL